MLAGKVEPVDVSKVVSFWDLLVLDVFRVFVLLLPELGLLKGLLELFVAEITKSASSNGRIGFNEFLISDLSEAEGVLVAVLAVERVCLLVLADIGLPADVHAVDFRDQQVHLVTWSVLQMQVSSLR